MAGNFINLDSSGRRRLNSSGQRAIGCTTRYIQAKKCGDGTAADVWLEYDAAGPNARINGTLTALPFSFYKNTAPSVVYTVDTTMTPSTTPGTIFGTAAGTATVTTTCSPCFTKTLTPNTMTITLAGITLCPGIPGTINGTYTLTKDAHTCSWHVNTGTVQIDLNAGELDVYLYNPALAGFVYVFLGGGITSSSDVYKLTTSTNAFTSSGSCSFGGTHGYGGTATFYGDP